MIQKKSKELSSEILGLKKANLIGIVTSCSRSAANKGF